MKLAQEERVAGAGKRFDRRLRQRVHVRGWVLEHRRQWTARVEVEALFGLLGDVAVLRLNLVA